MVPTVFGHPKRRRSLEILTSIGGCTYAMRRIGNGYQGLKRFLNLMNHPHPMTETNTMVKLRTVLCLKLVKVVAETIMQDACN